MTPEGAAVFLWALLAFLLVTCPVLTDPAVVIRQTSSPMSFFLISLLAQMPQEKDLQVYRIPKTAAKLSITQQCYRSMLICSLCSDAGLFNSISHNFRSQVSCSSLSELACREQESNSIHLLIKTQLLWGTSPQLLTDHSSSRGMALCTVHGPWIPPAICVLN